MEAAGRLGGQLGLLLLLAQKNEPTDPSITLNRNGRSRTAMSDEALNSDNAGDRLEVGIRLAQLGADTVVSEAELAKVVGRHRVSIRRAVERGELPAPFRAFGKPSWVVQSLLDHFRHLQASAAPGEET